MTKIYKIEEDLHMKHYNKMLRFFKANAESRTEKESEIILEQAIIIAQELLKHNK